jgi:hypothetical protein
MTTFHYSITIGLAGCYMPNHISGPYSGTTRKELVGMVRDLISMFADQEDDPSERSLLRQVKFKRLWAFIKHHGSSTAHFAIDIGRGEQIAFHGLTAAEAAAMDREND